MGWRVLCFCGTTYWSEDGVHGVCPYCDVALPGDLPPDTVPESWTNP